MMTCFGRQWAILSALTALFGTISSVPVHAQNYPITSEQRAVAQQVSQAGVPVSELSANAPDSYVVKRGDTLWGISGLFLNRPWRWPELWGMNLQEIKNPHLIYPGQTLYLEKKDGFARLRGSRSADGDTVRVSPRTRAETLRDSALPTLNPSLIEPFLAEPLVIDENTLLKAPRIVATLEDKVLLSRGDRAYARGEGGKPFLMDADTPRDYRVFRNAVPLKDPITGEILGYEAQYVGKAELVRGETTEISDTASAEVPVVMVADSADRPVTKKEEKVATYIVPATIDITGSKEEMRTGDRLLPEPPRQYLTYTPRAPQREFGDARVVSIYGSAVANAAQNQVVAINRGTLDGMEHGTVMAILSDGQRLIDKTDTSRPLLKLPSERNGMLMVFRTFDRVSYGLILDIRTGVKVGDKLVAPR